MPIVHFCVVGLGPYSMWYENSRVLSTHRVHLSLETYTTLLKQVHTHTAYPSNSKVTLSYPMNIYVVAGLKHVA